MITVEYARIMARYNQWQNRSLVRAADTLTDAARWLDRGAFFGSIAGTLNHVLWDDCVWLARLRADSAQAREIGARHPYTDTPRDWRDFTEQRTGLDAELVDWANGLSAAALDQPVAWVRGGQAVETPFAFNVAHMFNHQTHHRGQVHAMLTAAGAVPEPTDLQVLAIS